MTRDEAIEAGARALYEWAGAPDTPWETAAAEGWGYVETCREQVAAVLDAIGWTEPVGFVNVTQPRPEARVFVRAGQAMPHKSLEHAVQWRGRHPKDFTCALVPVEGPSKLGGNPGAISWGCARGADQAHPEQAVYPSVRTCPKLGARR